MAEETRLPADDPLTTPLTDADDLVLPENWDQDDAFFADAFQKLPAVQVSSEFLPRVMSKVYTHHARANIKLRHVLAYALSLFVLSIGFLMWDLLAAQKALGLESPGVAFMDKLQSLIGDANTSFSSVTGILSASWQMVTGLLSVAFTGANLPYLILVVVIVGIIAFALKKWISSLHIMDR